MTPTTMGPILPGSRAGKPTGHTWIVISLSPVFYIHLSWREATTHELGFPSEVESADVL